MLILSTTVLFSLVLFYTIEFRETNALKVSSDQFNDQWKSSFPCTRAEVVRDRICGHLDSGFKSAQCTTKTICLYDNGFENPHYEDHQMLECKLSKGSVRYITQGADYGNLVKWHDVGGFVHALGTLSFWAYDNYEEDGEEIDPLADVKPVNIRRRDFNPPTQSSLRLLN